MKPGVVSSRPNAQHGGLPPALLWVLPLGHGKHSGYSCNFATGCFSPEMRTVEQLLRLLVFEQCLTILSQEIHSRVQSCE